MRQRIEAAGALIPVVLVLSLLPGETGGSPAAAQEAPAAIFTEILDVRVVNLEVVVTNREGHRVTGLGPGDFRLRVDGREMEIAYFTEVRDGVAVAEGDEASAVAAAPDARPGEPVGISVLAFVDEFFSVTADRNRVLDALVEDLQHLGPNDRMAVVAYDGRRLEMLAGWTGSVEVLERTLRAARERPAYGLQRVAERRSAGARLPDQLFEIAGGAEFDRSMLQPWERAYVDRLVHQVEQAALAAASALRGFATAPGRKVMLLLSGGWPWAPAEYLFGEPDRLLLDHTRSSGDIYGVLTDTANRLGYTIYGVETPSPLISERAAVHAREDQMPQSGLLAREAIPVSEIRQSLARISEATGGEALLGRHRLAALAAVVEETRSYYWLGFRPDWRHDDVARSIEVEVTRPGLRVRSRSSYFDLSRDRQVAMQLESALVFGTNPQGLALPLRLGEPEQVRRRAVQVPLELAIPVDALALIPHDGRWVADLELRVLARDSDGRTADIPVIPLRLTLPEEPPRGAFVRYQTQLELRRQEHTLIVAIHDPAAGTLLAARAEFAP